MTGTTAVVVTYNRRQLLEKTLDGLQKQGSLLTRIVVFDNASTDGTQGFLESQPTGPIPVHVVRSEENLGGAGGFAQGMRVAYESGADSIWLMDDDTIPDDEALSALHAGMDDAGARLGYTPSFACSMVRWRDGSLCEMNVPVTTWDWSRGLALGATWQLAESCSFVSVLVTRESVFHSGLPLSDYFIWHDDAEYTYRLTRRLPGIHVPESRVTHMLPQNRGVNFGDVNEDNVWKFRYGVRNHVSTALRHRRPKMLAELAENMYGQLKGSAVPRRLRLQLLKAAMEGVTYRPEPMDARTVQ